MRIAILGAGGVGGYYGGVLARAGHPVAMLARGEHLAALRRRGIEVRTPEGTFTAALEAAGDPAELGEVELAIVAVKNYSLSEIAPAAQRLAESGATVLPLLNGVEVADRLAAAGVPSGQILPGLTQIGAIRSAPGVVERRSPFQRVVLGESAGGGSARAERIVAALREAGVEARVSDDITADLWRKFAFIVAMCAACGLARVPLGPIRQTGLGHLLLERGVREALAVGRARGVALAHDEEAKIVQSLDALGESAVPSFLLDLLAGGPTELDDLCGAVSRLGRLAGVETPIHDTATAALAATLSQQPERPEP